MASCGRRVLAHAYIYRIFDLPYQSQIIPLAAILADLDEDWNVSRSGQKLERWYWTVFFGELYAQRSKRASRAIFHRGAGLAEWGPDQTTVSETMFRADRLKTMRMRLSAAYKGVNALLMKDRAQDFRSGQKFDYAIFSGRMSTFITSFPDWCKKHDIKPDVFDSIINKHRFPTDEPHHRWFGALAVFRETRKGRSENAADRARQTRRLFPISLNRPGAFALG